MRYILTVLAAMVFCLGAATQPGEPSDTQPSTQPKNAAAEKLVRLLPAAMRPSKDDLPDEVAAKGKAARAWMNAHCKGERFIMTGTGLVSATTSVTVIVEVKVDGLSRMVYASAPAANAKRFSGKLCTISGTIKLANPNLSYGHRDNYYLSISDAHVVLSE